MPPPPNPHPTNVICLLKYVISRILIHIPVICSQTVALPLPLEQTNLYFIYVNKSARHLTLYILNIYRYLQKSECIYQYIKVMYEPAKMKLRSCKWGNLYVADLCQQIKSWFSLPIIYNLWDLSFTNYVWRFLQ